MNAYLREKKDWPPGPWHDEPDEKLWEDRNTGLQCIARRHQRYGHWIGYVSVREGHPAYGFEYYESRFDIDDVLSGKAAKIAPIQQQINNIQVGLTYSGLDVRRGKGWWLFGFDCSHVGEYRPGADDGNPGPCALGMPTGFEHPPVVAYRDLNYVIGQCAELAAALGRIRKE